MGGTVLLLFLLIPGSWVFAQTTSTAAPVTASPASLKFASRDVVTTIGVGNLTGLISIAVTPANPSILSGETQQFTATGLFRGGVALNLTALVVWGSSARGVATITAAGLASGVSPGGTTITATWGTMTPFGTGVTPGKPIIPSPPKNPISGSTTLTVTVVPLTIITTALPGGVVNTSYSETLEASGGTQPYTWSVTGGSLPGWATLDSSTGAITGTPTATGTSTFTVTVTDSSTPKQSQSEQFSIAVSATACGTGNETILQGQYVFSLSGFNATGYIAVVGAFQADGTGNIYGIADTNGALGPQTSTINSSASSYSVGSDNRGCATFATTFGTFTMHFALGTFSSGKATEGRMIEWETGSSAFIATGHILPQPAPLAALSGSYAFEESGVDSSNHRFGGVGVISASSGSFINGEVNVNDAGTPQHITGITGTYGSGPPSGRFTFTTAVPGGGTTHGVGYKVSSSQFLFVTTDAVATSGVVLTGEMTLQSVPVGGFSNSSLSGTMVYYLTGLNSPGSGGRAGIGLFSATGSGSVTATNYEDDAGTWSSPNPSTGTCTYSVASNGRITLSGGAGCGAGAPVLYLTAANTAFTLGEDSSVGIGQVEPQVVPAGGFTNASFPGTYYVGDLEVVNQLQETGVGVVTVDSSGNTTNTTDYTKTTNQSQGQTSTGPVSVNSDGTISFSGLIGGIIISSTKTVVVDNDTQAYPNIEVAKQ